MPEGYGLDELDSLQLESLDKQGRPPRPSRLSSANDLRSLYMEEIRQDEKSAIARARVQAMKDGEPPYNQAALNASGQGSRANANFLMGQDLINTANNGYNDIVTSVKKLVTVNTEFGEGQERSNFNRIIAEELTRTIRKWKGFNSNFQQLVDLFTTHGVGIGYFPDSKDFRFEVAGFGEIMIPRQTKACEDKILYAIARRDMTVTELYEPIEDEELATEQGWNVRAVKAAIGRATDRSSMGQIGEIEQFQQQIKNNDLYAGKKYTHVPVLHGWVKEFDGSISFFMAEKDAADSDFLYKEYSRYASADEAYIFFTYGIGNGTYHSIRGLGHMIFALVQLHNKLMNQKADSTILADSIMLQTTSANALQSAAVNQIGPMAILDSSFEVVDRPISAGSERTLPFLGEVKSLMGQVSSRFMAPTGGNAQAYENELDTESRLESAANGDSGAIELFYSAWDRLIREMVRRIVKGPKSDPLIKEFYARCEKAGVTQEVLDELDHDSTYSYRALGAGSPAARSLGFKKLIQLLPQLDEIGRKNLIYEFVADVVGYQNADEFAAPADEVRLNGEAGQAELENILLMQGNEIVVLPYQMHATHVQIHLPYFNNTVDMVERGELDPMESLGGLQAQLNHLAAHGEQLAQDPTQAALYGLVKETINNLQQIITNMERKIKAEERTASEGQVAPDQPGFDVNAEKMKQEQLKTRILEIKADAAARIGELKISEQIARSEQNLALADIKGAEQVQKKLRYPSSDIGMRR